MVKNVADLPRIMGPEKIAPDLAEILKTMSELPIKIEPSNRREKFTNRARVAQVLSQSDLAAIISIKNENVSYFSGYYNLEFDQATSYLHIAVWPTEGAPVFICPEMGPGRQKIDPFVQDVRVYGRGFTPTPMQLLADLIWERNWNKERLGIERDAFPLAHYEELIAQVPDAQFVDCQYAIGEIKMIKTPGEIELLHFASRATNKAIHLAYELARSGDTEKSIVDRIGLFITRLGADRVAFNVAASGERTVLGHHYAEEIPLKPGDLYRVDYGGLFSGYYTDMVRMAVVGEPSNRQRSTYQKIVEIHREMLDGLRPGAIPRKVVAKALRHYVRAGLPPTRSLYGHSIGLAVVEPPKIIINEEREMEANMVLSVENGWSDEALMERYHIEDMILITENGHKLLSDYSPFDELFVIR